MVGVQECALTIFYFCRTNATMRFTFYSTLIWLAGIVPAVPVVADTSHDRSYYLSEKEFDQMTQAEHTRAKRRAETAQIRPLVACADPGNMPLSNMEGEGFDNRIAELLAESLNTSLSYFWRPYHERGLTRETFANKECDLLLGMPFAYSTLLTTIPIYRTTYVFAYRQDMELDIQSLHDPVLASLRVGVYQHSGIREALTRHGVANITDLHIIRQNTDLVPQNQQWYQVQKLVDGKMDIAAVWGPFAGYMKTKKQAPITLQPVNLMEDRTPLEFSLAIGMRKNDVVLKYALDNAIKENAGSIEAILREFGVPLVACSECGIQGDLPSHGSYFERFIEETRQRFLKPLSEDLRRLDLAEAAPDQVVDQERLDMWLEQGADPDVEMENAVLAGDPVRIRYLAQLGADLDRVNNQGYGLLHKAARSRDSETLRLLTGLGADPDLKDINGWTALMHAAYRNHVPSVEILVAAGAGLELKSANLYSALAIAVGERKFWAAKALLDAGASVNTRVGLKQLSPLMLVARHHKTTEREKHIIEGAEPLEVAERLLELGADANEANADGETPLMYAAAHDNPALIAVLVQHGADLERVSAQGMTALEIAEENNSDGAIKSLKLFAGFNRDRDHSR